MSAIGDVLGRLRTLQDPLCGVVGRTTQIPRLSGYPRLYAYSTESRGLPSDGAAGLPLAAVSGAGIALDPELAELRALAEAVERYCMSVHSPGQLVRATARELGDEALDLDRLARCHESELGLRNGRVSLPSKDARVRWVRGTSLVDGRPLYVPAVMVYLFFPPEGAHENFWVPISTGCALHGDLHQALLSGLLEVVERDSLSLTWLHQLPLPELDLGPPTGWPGEVRTLLEQTAEAGLECRFFDATSDLGLPTVYTLQLNAHTELLANLVVCATRLDPWQAVARTIEEGCASRLALDARLGGAPQAAGPRAADEVHELEDCALHYARREARAEFDFLLRGEGRRPIGALPSPGTGEARADLASVVGDFARRGYEVVAVDLTPPEVRAAGFWAVRVIVPELVPMTPVHGQRFLATPRLYQAPAAMGYGLRRVEDVTDKLQPFA